MVTAKEREQKRNERARVPFVPSTVAPKAKQIPPKDRRPPKNRVVYEEEFAGRKEQLHATKGFRSWRL